MTSEGKRLVDGGSKEKAPTGASWPSGLRALLWASAVGLVIEAAQLYVFGIVRGELGPPPSLKGMSALGGLVLGLILGVGR